MQRINQNEKNRERGKQMERDIKNMEDRKENRAGILKIVLAFIFVMAIRNSIHATGLHYTLLTSLLVRTNHKFAFKICYDN